MHYRPHIDGLRGIAVLSIVLFHLKPSLCPGGYVGVDIFFVISGYLITRRSWSDLSTGRFRLSDFYVRRIRRIAPALFVTIATTLLAGALLLQPGDLLRLGHSALWATTGAANVYFWRSLDTGYFARSSDELPLLHTWSIGVEEQFYLLWPACLVALARWHRFLGTGPRRQMPSSRIPTFVTLAIAVASFVVADLANERAQKFAYFMLPARAGELMIGGLLAFALEKLDHDKDPPDAGQSTRAKLVREGTALLGVALIAAALWRLDQTSRFPGRAAALPCIGAALVIFAGERGANLVTRVLSSRPFVYLGLVSYSVYLWHWPLAAFARYFLADLSTIAMLTSAAATLCLATLTYRFIEVPARRSQASPRRQVLTFLAAPAVFLCASAGGLVLTDGLKASIETPAFRASVAHLHAETAPSYEFPYICGIGAMTPFDPSFFRRPRCVVGPSRTPASEPQILLWGDSHAAHYVGALGALARDAGFYFRNATHSACPPVFGGDYGMQEYHAGCSRFRPMAESVLRSGAYSTVIMSSGWATYDSHYPGFRTDVESTVDALTALHIRVVIIGQAPQFPRYDQECERRAIRVGGLDCHGRAVMADTGVRSINRYLRTMARAHHATFVDVHDLFCHGGKCDPYLDGEPAYADANHLSTSGSWRLGQKLLAAPERAEWLGALGVAAAP